MPWGFSIRSSAERDYAAIASRFLRASRPNPTKPVTKSGSEPGSGIADGGEVSNTAVRRGLDASGLVEEAYDIGRQG